MVALCRKLGEISIMIPFNLKKHKQTNNTHTKKKIPQNPTLGISISQFLNEEMAA